MIYLPIKQRFFFKQRPVSVEIEMSKQAERFCYCPNILSRPLNFFAGEIKRLVHIADVSAKENWNCPNIIIVCEKFEFSRTSKERCTKIRGYSQKKAFQSILVFELLAGEIKRLVIIARQLLEYPRKTEIAQISWY